MHTLKEVDMLYAKMYSLMKRIENQSNEKQDVMQAYDSHMTCEVCGNTRYLGNTCSETQEDVNFINNNPNGYRPQQQQGQGWNQ
jgi:chromatin remodeling complex protein RSC6